MVSPNESDETESWPSQWMWPPLGGPAGAWASTPYPWPAGLPFLHPAQPYGWAPSTGSDGWYQPAWDIPAHAGWNPDWPSGNDNGQQQKLLAMCCEKNAAAITALQAVVAQGCHPCISSYILQSISIFESASGPAASLPAVLALHNLRCALAACSNEAAQRAALLDAEKHVRDALTVQCQLRVPLGDKDAYDQALKQAFGTHEFSHDEYSKLMNSYFKVIGKSFPEAFQSFNQRQNQKRGRPRPKRERRREGTPEPTAQEPEIQITPPPRPPPGLEIVADIGSEVSFGSFATGGKRHAPKQHVPRDYHVHVGGARTHFSIASNTDFAELDHADPDEVSDGGAKDEQRILVMTELDRILVARSKHRTCDSSKEYKEEFAEFANGYILYFRPGAKEFVAALLKEPRIVLSIVSATGHWVCLPAMRLLLEKAMEGTKWFVEGDFQGDWHSYLEGCNYTIVGSELRWPRSSADVEDGDGTVQTCELVFTGKDRCLVREWPGQWRPRYGRLTPDGTLLWTWSEEGDGADGFCWTVAARTAPPCLVERDGDLRVYVFDNDCVCDRVENENQATSAHEIYWQPSDWGNDGSSWSSWSYYRKDIPDQSQQSTNGNGSWSYYRKEINRVWSALAEAKCGSFGTHNSVLIDEQGSGDTSSHPDNVIPIRRWDLYAEETGDQMAKLSQYLLDLSAAQPGEVTEYMSEHVCDAFKDDLNAPKAQWRWKRNNRRRNGRPW